LTTFVIIMSSQCDDAGYGDTFFIVIQTVHLCRRYHVLAHKCSKCR